VTDGVHKLGEVLRAARESKGVDLTRVERETKIRERYLSALERGDYRELPGSVYTKGFLRNYGAYLGLDPEYLIDLYRLETSTGAVDRPVAPAPPRPLTTRRRGSFVVSPGALVGTILTIVVGALVIWIGYEFVNFARTPELRIVQPAGDVAAHRGETITVRGVTAANATVTISGLRENPTITAGADGKFEVTVNLLPGSNVIEMTAHDPVTDRDSEPVIRTVQVVTDVATSPSPTALPMALGQPAADAAIIGAVPISGTAAPASSLQLTAALVTAAVPNFSVTDGAGAAVTIQPITPVAPAPATLAADPAGAFAGSLVLPPGTWDVTVTPAAGEAVTRRVTVSLGAGLAGVLLLEGGDSYLEVDQDGAPLASVNGTIADDGEQVALSASRELRIVAGNAGAIRLTVNGISIGSMGSVGQVVEWRITRSGS
jgi:cytoskeletal protein RodZ